MNCTGCDDNYCYCHGQQAAQSLALSLDDQIALAAVELRELMRSTNEAYLRLHHLRFQKRMKEIR